jgi:hypothetical protein
MRRLAIRTALVLLFVFLAIQLVPVERSNPPLESEVPAPPEVRTVLRRACYDCHSNETKWPWYSRIAPVSWQIQKDVRAGREALNYSTWNRLEPKKQAKAMRESWEEVAEGEMPPWFYLLPHPEANLSTQDRDVLKAWAALAGPPAPGAEGEDSEGSDDD